MDSQSKNDLIFYGGLALFLWWLASRNKTRPLTWQVDPATGNLVPAQAAVNPLLPLIQQATSAPLVSPDITANVDQGSASLTWEIDPVTGLLRPPGSAPGASGGW
jgi:hypothetical protein